MVDFEFTQEQLMIKEAARDFADKELVKGAAERDEKEQFPYEQIKQMAELGFMGMMVPPEHGGAGLDTVSYVLALEEISRGDASAGVIMSVNNSLVCWGLEKFGNDLQKEKYLKPLASGKTLGAFCLSEPEAGSDAVNQRTTAVRDGDRYVINGTKNFITNGASADVLLVMATTDKTKGARGVSTFIVEKKFPGVIVSKKEHKLGIRSSDTAQITFQDCGVPVENRINEEGFGFKFAMMTLDGGRIGIASQAIGIARAALDASLKYVKERKAFDKLLYEFQAIQFKLAEMHTNIEAAHLLTLNAALKKDRGERFTKEAAMAKLFASKIAVDCALEAIQIHGGYGYLKDFPVERYLRDAKITEIYEGTSEIQRIVIAREVLDLK
ncbi:MAG: acyl-CoA dehydrogenase [Bacteroidetes bacterium]|nr:acyl-CoA dehydrogenase [Bacteroidota bacterium]MCL5738063.1 acyl-CoA dehydrogenase [Bacteroidota bacterium]